MNSGDLSASPTVLHQGYKTCHCAWPFTWAMGMQSQVFMLVLNTLWTKPSPQNPEILIWKKNLTFFISILATYFVIQQVSYSKYSCGCTKCFARAWFWTQWGGSVSITCYTNLWCPDCFLVLFFSLKGSTGWFSLAQNVASQKCCIV